MNERLSCCSCVMALLSLTIFLSGCRGFFSTRKKARFNISLVDVKRTNEKNVKWTNRQIQNKGTPGKKTHTFHDDLLSVKWRLRGEAVDYSLTNRAETPLRIDWNRVRYHVTGHKPRVPLRPGERHDVNITHSPMIIPVNQSRDGSFLPKGYIEHVDTYRQHRYQLLPVRQQIYESERDFTRRAKSWKNASIQITLPVHDGSDTFTYHFQFRIQSVQFSR